MKLFFTRPRKKRAKSCVYYFRDTSSHLKTWESKYDVKVLLSYLILLLCIDELLYFTPRYFYTQILNCIHLASILDLIVKTHVC